MSTTISNYDQFLSFLGSFRNQNLGIDLSSYTSVYNATENNIQSLDSILAFLLKMPVGDYAKSVTLHKVDDSTSNLSSNAATPSYNIRTPRVEIWVNGTQVIKPGEIKDGVKIDFFGKEKKEGEKTPIKDTLFGKDIDVQFKNLDLNMALGGPLGTITGVLTLFSRDPLDFLTFLYDFNINGVEELDALPSLSLRFGWTVSDTTQPEKSSTVLSPVLNFLVMNVQMADPSSELQGSTFTLQLQDSGSAVYDNSVSDFGLTKNYPQQQLRALLEGVMKTRLFTLDDFLNSPSIKNSVPASYKSLNPHNAAEFKLLVSLLHKVQYWNTDPKAGKYLKGGIIVKETDDINTITEAEFTVDSLQYLSGDSKWQIVMKHAQLYGGKANLDHDKQLANFLWGLANDPNLSYFMDSLWEIPGTASGNSFRKGNLLFHPNMTSAGVYEPADFSWNLNFLYSKLRYENQKVWLDQAAARAVISCKDPDELGIKKAYMFLTDALKKDVLKILSKTDNVSPDTIMGILSQYSEMALNTAMDQLKQEAGSLLEKTFFLNDELNATRLNSNSFREIIIDLVSKIQYRWYPVSNAGLPDARAEAGVASSQAYSAYMAWKNAVGIKSADEVAKLKQAYLEHKERKSYGSRLVYVSNVPKNILTTSGTKYFDEKTMSPDAFILVPNISPFDCIDTDIPLIFGPGASSYPYLYGAAQNVKQVASTFVKKGVPFPQLYGEVLDAKANYNNLTAVMKATYNEQTLLAQAGERLSKATTFVPGISSEKTEEQKKQENDVKEKFLRQQLKDMGYDNMSIDDYVEERKKSLYERLKRQNLKHFSIFEGKKFLLKADKDGTSALDRAYTNPVGARQSAKDHIAQRLGNILYSATSVSVAVPGDPFLIRQGVGAFELLHYFIDKSGTGVRYNYFLSGVYFVQSISHSISAGSFVTNLKGFKLPQTNNTFTGLVDYWRRKDIADVKAGVTSTTEEQELISTLMETSINLETANSNKLTNTIINGSVINTEVGSNNSALYNPINEKLNKFYFNVSGK